jgi:hypothetical protein
MHRDDLLREAIRIFVRVQAARRLAALGGEFPEMPEVSRRAARYRAMNAVLIDTAVWGEDLR